MNYFQELVIYTGVGFLVLVYFELVSIKKNIGKLYSLLNGIYEYNRGNPEYREKTN